MPFPWANLSQNKRYLRSWAARPHPFYFEVGRPAFQVLTQHNELGRTWLAVDTSGLLIDGCHPNQVAADF
jgi:hypothetical protein